MEFGGVTEEVENMLLAKPKNIYMMETADNNNPSNSVGKIEKDSKKQNSD